MEQKYKIGIDARMYRRSTGGIGRYIHGLLEGLSKIDKVNRYFIFLTDEDLAEYELKATNFKPIRAPYPHYSIKEQVGFLRMLNSYKLDLVHFTNFNFPVFYRGKFIVTIHDMTMTLFPAPGRQTQAISRLLYHFVLKMGTKKAKKIIVVSKNTKSDLNQILKSSKEKIVVIHHAVDKNYYPERSEKKKMVLQKKYNIISPYILFVSQWRPHKNIKGLVKSFEILHQRFQTKDLRLVIVGKPNPKFPEIERCINNSKLRSKIITPGFVDEKDMTALYSNAEVFVFPSFYEGFGLNPLEAMACGTAVTASCVSSIPEVCDKAALYFDPQDSEDVALKTHTLLTNHLLREKLIGLGFENLKRFSWLKTAKKTHATYLSILKNS